MAADSINRQVLGIAVPSILANITVPLVGIVDLAISGHLGDAACIGGLAIGSMLFDLLYWNMGFLRTGTGGITAQAFGRKDSEGMADTFTQGITTALAFAALCIALQWVFVTAAFLFIDCSPEVEAIARRYFFIRIWAAPATLCLYVFKGWFIGLQNSVFSMTVDIWVNLINAGASWLLAFRTPLGVAGVAAGTLIAQWTGLILASGLAVWRYRGILSASSLRRSLHGAGIRRFFAVNTDLFVRSLGFMVIYIGFTSIAARYGDLELAVSALMMQMFMIFSYVVDGFAFAGEALTGRFIGEKDRESLISAIRVIFVWSAVISTAFTLAYALFPTQMLGIMTDDTEVLDGCGPYLFWLLLMPVLSCMAFVLDGIYLGATASAAMRNCMLIAAAIFILTYLAFRKVWGIQALYLAYFVHLAYRSAHLAATLRRRIIEKSGRF